MSRKMQALLTNSTNVNGKSWHYELTKLSPNGSVRNSGNPSPQSLIDDLCWRTRLFITTAHRFGRQVGRDSISAARVRLSP